jgi:hypothetical protein
MRIYLTFATLLVVTLAKAQEEKVIIIDRGASYKNTQQVRKPEKLVDNDYVMKFSPLQMIMGEINLGFEKRVDEMSSIEFEFGPTLSEVGFSVNSNHYSPDPWGFNYSGRSTGVGFFGSVGYRFYPMDNTVVLNRFYVSPVFKYRLFNFGVEDYSKVLPSQKGSEGQAIFTFNFGYQKWLSDHFSLDMFAGFGLAYESHKDFFTESIYDDVSGMYTFKWVNNNYSGVRFAGTMGVKVGIGR